MTSDTVTVTSQEGMVVLRSGMRTVWLSPLDALDLGQEITNLAERVGAEVVQRANHEREVSAKAM